MYLPKVTGDKSPLSPYLPAGLNSWTTNLNTALNMYSICFVKYLEVLYYQVWTSKVDNHVIHGAAAARLGAAGLRSEACVMKMKTFWKQSIYIRTVSS